MAPSESSRSGGTRTRKDDPPYLRGTLADPTARRRRRLQLDGPAVELPRPDGPPARPEIAPVFEHRGHRMRRVLAAADAVSVVATLLLALLLDAVTRFDTAPIHFAVLVPVSIVVWTALAAVTGAYHVDERRIDCSTAEEIGRITQTAALWVWAVFLIETLGSSQVIAVTPAVTIWLLSIPTILVGRWTVRQFVRGAEWFQETAVIIGTPDDTGRIARILERHPEFAIEVIERIDIRPTVPQLDYASTMASDRLLRTVAERRPDRVIFASTYEGLDENTGALRYLVRRGFKVDLVPGDSDVFRSDAELHHVEGLPFLTLPTKNRDRSSRFVKRAFDVLLAAVGMVVLAPVFLFCALRIKLDSKGPVFFRQKRIGYRGREFELVKFRTMVVGADEMKQGVEALNDRNDGMFKIADDPRITKVGNSLRLRSLDELPQLINVLRGDMSLVGPRPLIPEESALVEDDYKLRWEMIPGITGPWQVLGRSDIPFAEMLKLDYTYVVNWSMSEDIKLLARTLNAVGARRGAY